MYNFKFNSEKLISNVKAPTTIFHGNDDTLVPIELTKKLYAQSNKDNTEFVGIEGGTHHNLEKLKIYKKKIEHLLK